MVHHVSGSSCIFIQARSNISFDSSCAIDIFLCQCEACISWPALPNYCIRTDSKDWDEQATQLKKIKTTLFWINLFNMFGTILLLGLLCVFFPLPVTQYGSTLSEITCQYYLIIMNIGKSKKSFQWWMNWDYMVLSNCFSPSCHNSKSTL